MLKLKLQYFGHLMWRTDSLEKTLMLGKIEDGRRRGRQDEMVGWHHQLNGHEFKWTSGVGDGQGGLMCCSPWGCKESDMTEQLSWTGWDWNSQKCRDPSVYIFLPCVWCLVVVWWAFLNETLNVFQSPPNIGFLWWAGCYWKFKDEQGSLNAQGPYILVAFKSLFHFEPNWNLDLEFTCWEGISVTQVEGGDRCLTNRSNNWHVVEGKDEDVWEMTRFVIWLGIGVEMTWGDLRAGENNEREENNQDLGKKTKWGEAVEGAAGSFCGNLKAKRSRQRMVSNRAKRLTSSLLVEAFRRVGLVPCGSRENHRGRRKQREIWRPLEMSSWWEGESNGEVASQTKTLQVWEITW